MIVRQAVKISAIKLLSILKGKHFTGIEAGWDYGLGLVKIMQKTHPECSKNNKKKKLEIRRRKNFQGRNKK